MTSATIRTTMESNPESAIASKGDRCRSAPGMLRAFRRPLLLILIALAGCKTDRVHHWSDEPLWPTTVKLPDPNSLGNARTVSVTIDLPRGFHSQGKFSGVEWSSNPDDYMFDPHIAISTGLTHTQADNRNSMTPESEIVRKEELADGLLIVGRRGDDVVRAESWRRLTDETSVKCLAMQARRNVPDADGTLRWLERICRSLRVNSQ